MKWHRSAAIEPYKPSPASCGVCASIGVRRAGSRLVKSDKEKLAAIVELQDPGLHDLLLLSGLHEADRYQDLAACVVVVKSERPVDDGIGLAGDGDALLEDVAQFAQFGHDA